jgi:hypothetical protein
LRLLHPFDAPGIVAQRIVPVRFARAVSGFADDDAPDLDDHGFLTTTFGPARGPTVGVFQGATIRVKLMRDRLDSTAPLFVSSEDTSLADVVFPEADTALSATDTPAADDGSTPERKGDCIYIQGTSTANSTQEVLVKVHHGASDGPVLAELGVRVYPRLTIRVQVHAVSINGTAPTTTIATARAVFRKVSKVYAQAGIEFSVVGGMQAETVTGFARAGTVTLSNVPPDEQNVELQTVLSQRPDRNMLNAYYFGHYFDTGNTSGGPTGTLDQVLGIAFSRQKARANPATPGFPGCQVGISMRDSADDNEAAHTAAHEIGHALTLEHYDNGNDQTGAVSDVRQDLWAHRDLMHNFVNLVAGSLRGEHYKSSTARIQVGYGNYADGRRMTGQLLMNKQRSLIFQSQQVNLVRRAMLADSYKPV